MIDALRARGAEVVRLDTDRFPVHLTLRVRQDREGSLRELVDEQTGEAVDLSTVDAVWYRRFYTAKLPADTDPAYVKHCKREAHTFLRGLFASLRHARWVDPIDRVRLASQKLLQLDVAREVGLDIPDTLATNDPDEVRRFFDSHDGHIVTKIMSSFAIEDTKVEYVVYTSPFTEADFEEIDGLRLCPMVFQERVDKDVELRVTVVGDRLFVASVDASRFDRARVDWRRAAWDVAVEFEPDTLPDDVAEAVLKLTQRYGLVYSAIDIIRTPDGRHVFLENNPAGEWHWIQATVGHPIAEAHADVLLGEVVVDRPAPDLS